MISIKFWQNINQQLSRLYTFINSENISETLLKNVSLCDLLTAFAEFHQVFNFEKFLIEDRVKKITKVVNFFCIV